MFFFSAAPQTDDNTADRADGRRDTAIIPLFSACGPPVSEWNPSTMTKIPVAWWCQTAAALGAACGAWGRRQAGGLLTQ